MAEINRKLSRKILNLRYGDKKKKTQITNWKSITKLFKQNEYVNSVPEVSRLLKSKHDIKLSTQKIKEHLEQKLSRLRSLDWEEYKGYKKISKYIKNQDGRWIPHRRQIYIYWYKFLQLAIVEGRKIDWEKYKGWSGSNFVLSHDFLDWWQEHKAKLFEVDNPKDTPKFTVSMRNPNYDTIRYAYLVYERKDFSDKFMIAKDIYDSEKRKRRNLDKLQQFIKIGTKEKKIFENKVRGESEYQRLLASGLDSLQIQIKVMQGELDRKEIMKIKNRRIVREYVKSVPVKTKKPIIDSVNRYMRYAKSIMDNVCVASYPGSTLK